MFTTVDTKSQTIQIFLAYIRYMHYHTIYTRARTLTRWSTQYRGACQESRVWYLSPVNKQTSSPWTLVEKVELSKLLVTIVVSYKQTNIKSMKVELSKFPVTSTTHPNVPAVSWRGVSHMPNLLGTQPRQFAGIQLILPSLQTTTRTGGQVGSAEGYTVWRGRPA